MSTGASSSRFIRRDASRSSQAKACHAAVSPAHAHFIDSHQSSRCKCVPREAKKVVCESLEENLNLIARTLGHVAGLKGGD